MTKFAVNRLLSGVLTMLLVTVFASTFVDLVPGDPAVAIVGEFATPDAVESVQQTLQLDRPVVERMTDFVGRTGQGDLGTSAVLLPGRPVATVLKDAIPVTASLALFGLIFMVVIGVLAGVVAGTRPGGIFDRLVVAFSAASMAIPTFVLGPMFVAFFAVDRTWFPALGYKPPSEGIWQWAQHLILPAATIAVHGSAQIARQVRGALTDVAQLDYISAAVARGLGRRTILLRHVSRNAAPQVLTVIGFQVALILGGSIIVERVFGLSGVGSVAYTAVTRRDIPVVQAIIITMSLVIIVVNILVDLSQMYLQPKLRGR